MKQPNVLLINDDGINAKGIWHLWNALKDFAKITIVAPAQEQSAKGLSITIDGPLRSQEVQWEDNTPAWQVFGTPADCVRVALSVLKLQPDLIVSGINKGCNSGRNILYSGTIGGVIDGVFRNIPGIAFSCKEFYNPSYETYEMYIPMIVAHFLKHPAPKGTMINVNFPKHTADIQGMRFAKQGVGYWVEEYKETKENSHHFDTKWAHGLEDEESDVALLKKGFITVSPIKVEELTHLEHFAEHKEIFHKLNETL